MTNIHNFPDHRFIDAAADAAERAFCAVERAGDTTDPKLAKLRLEMARKDFDLACRYLTAFVEVR